MNWKIFIIEGFLFSLTLILGITTAFRLNEIFQTQKIEIPQISFWKFILNFLLATLFILFIVHLVKFKKGKELFFKILFILAVFLGGLLCLEVWLQEPPSFNYYFSFDFLVVKISFSFKSRYFNYFGNSWSREYVGPSSFTRNCYFNFNNLFSL